MSSIVTSSNQVPQLNNEDAINSVKESKNKVVEYTAENIFYNEFSDADALAEFLYLSGVADDTGFLIEGKGNFPLPSLSEKIIKNLLDVTSEELEVEFQGEHFKFSINKLLTAEGEKRILEFLGGVVRQQLTSDPEYVADALSALTGKFKEEINPYLTSSVLSESQRKLPDHDMRVLKLGETKEKLEELIQKIADIFAQNLYTSVASLRPHIISTMQTVEKNEKKTLFSIITLKAKQKEYDIVFWSKGERKYLSIADAIRIALSENKKDLRIISDIGFGWQSFLDILLKIKRIPNPEEVNHMGFPMVISYLTEGNIIADAEKVIPILRDRSLKIEGDEDEDQEFGTKIYDPALKLAKSMSKVCSNHHGNNTNAAAALACNASFYLTKALPGESFKRFWNALVNGYPKSPLFNIMNQIMKMKDGKIEDIHSSLSFAAFIGLVTNPPKNGFSIRHHPKDKAIQIFLPDSGCTLFVPLDLTKAISDLENSDKLDILIPLIENVVFQSEKKEDIGLHKNILKKLGINETLLKEKSLALINSGKPANRYLGFLLFSALLHGETNSANDLEILQLLSKLSSLSKTQQTNALKLILSFMLRCDKTKIANLLENYTPDTIGNIELIKGLAATQNSQNIQTAGLLYKELQKSLTLAERSLYDLQIAHSFLPKGLITAASLLRAYYKDCSSVQEKEEKELLFKMLNQASSFENKGLVRAAPLLLKCVSSSLSRFKIYPSNCLQGYIKNLIKNNLSDNALQITEAVIAAVPNIRGVWKEWFEASVQNPPNVQFILAKVKNLQSTLPKIDVVFWDAMQILIFNESTEELAFSSLMAIKESNGLDKRITSIAKAKIQALLTDRKNQGVAVHKVIKKYEPLLDADYYQNIVENQISLNLSKTNYEALLDLWLLLRVDNTSENVRNLTCSILDKFTETQYFLKEAKIMLDRLQNSALLSREEYARYLLRVLDLASNEINKDFIALHTIFKDSALSADTYGKLAQRIVKQVSQLGNLNSEQRSVLTGCAPNILKSLVKNEQFELSDRLINQWVEHQLFQKDDPIFAKYYNQLIAKCIERREFSVVFNRLEQLEAIENPVNFRQMIYSVRVEFYGVDQIKFYLKYADALLQTGDRSTLTSEAMSIVFHKGASDKISFELLESFPPEKIEHFIQLFERAPQHYKKICDRFEIKQDLPEPSMKLLSRCIFNIAKKMAEKKENKGLFDTLLEQISDPNSVFSKCKELDPELFSELIFIIVKNMTNNLDNQVRILALYDRVDRFVLIKSSHLGDWIESLLFIGKGLLDSYIRVLDLIDLALQNKTNETSLDLLIGSIEKISDIKVPPAIKEGFVKKYIKIWATIKSMSFGDQIYICDHLIKSRPTQLWFYINEVCDHLFENSYQQLSVDEQKQFGNLFSQTLILTCQHSNSWKTASAEDIMTFLASWSGEVRVTEEATDRIINFAIDYLIKVITPADSDIFYGSLFQLIDNYVTSEVDFYELDSRSSATEIMKVVVPFYDYEVTNSSVEIKKGQSDFIHFINRFIRKIMDTEFTNESQMVYFNRFAMATLKVLINRFPDRIEEVVETINAIFYYTPKGFVYDLKERQTLLKDFYTQLSDLSKDFEIFEYHYLTHFILQPSPGAILEDFIPSSIRNIFKFDSINAPLLAIQLLKNAQSELINNRGEVEECYELIFNYIEKHTHHFQNLRSSWIYQIIEVLFDKRESKYILDNKFIKICPAFLDKLFNLYNSLELNQLENRNARLIDISLVLSRCLECTIFKNEEEMRMLSGYLEQFIKLGLSLIESLNEKDRLLWIEILKEISSMLSNNPKQRQIKKIYEDAILKIESIK